MCHLLTWIVPFILLLNKHCLDCNICLWSWQKARPINLTEMNPTTTDPFKELMDNLCRVLTVPAPASAPSTSVTSPNSSSPLVYVASPMVNPAPYSGSVEDSNGFLLQHSIALEMQRIASPLRRPKSHSSCHYWLDVHCNGQKLWNQAGPVT